MAKKKRGPFIKEIDFGEKKEYFIWQGYTEGESFCEPALHVKGYSDVIEIDQQKIKIRISYESVDTLIKILTKIKRSRKK